MVTKLSVNVIMQRVEESPALKRKTEKHLQELSMYHILFTYNIT